MKIAIFGGLGYLGSRLTDFFLSLNYDITVVTHRRNFSIDQKKLVFQKKNINIAKSNAPDFNIDNLIEKNNICIFLSYLNQKKSKSFQKKSLRFSKDQSIVLANSFNKFKNKTLIYMSSAHVYEFKNKVNENSKLAINKSIYSNSKIIFENNLIKKFNNKNNKLKIIRLANTFGYPGKFFSKNSDCWNLLINQICLKAIQKKKMIIKSKINITQNYLSINKLCLFLNHLINNPVLYKGHIINLGDKNLSLTELIEILQKILYKNKILAEIKFNKSFDVNYNNNFFFTSIYKNNQFTIEENEFEDEFENLISYIKKYKNIYN